VKLTGENSGTPEYGEIQSIRRKVLWSAYSSQEGHVPSALSIIEPTYSVFKDWDVLPGGRDSFILSKGHGSLALYCALEHFGEIETQELSKIGKKGGSLGGHPDRTKVASAIASTGSLGHGFPIGVGIAYAKKNFSGEGRVFVLVGDGECNEGSTWEAAMLAASHRLSNLTVWVDFNRSGDRALQLDPLAEKWSAFGFEVIEVDGHNLSEIRLTINAEKSRPTAIIGHSIKGKGVSFMENAPQWHHAAIDEETYNRAIGELQ
jgi:transketolase